MKVVAILVLRGNHLAIMEDEEGYKRGWWLLAQAELDAYIKASNYTHVPWFLGRSRPETKDFAEQHGIKEQLK